jgi:hypothetical protein
MAKVLTGKQRAAIEALEAARSQGCSLTQYARTHGLNAQRIYAMLSVLRKQGLLPKSGRQLPSRFVAVSVQSAPAHPALVAPGIVCRVLYSNQCIVECLQWPAPSWVLSLSQGSSNAAA